MPTTRGFITVVPPSGLTVSVTITTAAGTAVTSYTAESGSSSHASPKSISASTDFHLPTTGLYRVVTTYNGVTIDDSTVSVSSYGAGPAVVSPDIDTTTERASSSGTSGVPGGLVGASELLPFGADEWSRLGNGWVDESSGTTTLAIKNDRGAGGATYTPYLRVTTTDVADVAQLASPPMRVDASKAHRIDVKCKRLSGAVAMEVVALCFSNGSDVSAGTVTLFTAYDPGAAWVHKNVLVNPVGGAAPAFPANTDRVVLLVKPTVGTVGSVAIDQTTFAEERKLHNAAFGSTGGHEAVYDPTTGKVFISSFFSGFIAEMSSAGIFQSNVPAVYSGQNDPHQMIVVGDFIYSAQWTTGDLGKHRISDRTLVATLALSAGNAYGLCFDGTYLYVLTNTAGTSRMHKVDPVTFTEVAGSPFVIAADPSGTEMTPILLGGSVWIHSSNDGKVYRYSKAGVLEATINPPAGLASNRNYGFGATTTRAYLSFKAGFLCEYNPASNAISNTWHIGAASDGQIKTDPLTGCLWFPAGDTVAGAMTLVRFDPATGRVARFPMQRLSGDKWCEIVGDEVWCGGLGDGRLLRYARV